jgi:phage-related protein
MSYSFTLDSVDLGGTDYGLYIVSGDESLMPRPRVIIENLTGADGAATMAATFEPLYINLVCMVKASSQANLRTQLGNIVTLLKTCQVEEKSLVFDRTPSDTYTVRLLSGVNASVMLTGAEFTLQFLAANPFPS